jgi:hypothetical protein
MKTSPGTSSHSFVLRCRALPLALATAAVLGLAGCDATTQTTSGESYLERYPTPTGSASVATDLDSMVAQVAAIEPQLRFPARIGLARIEGGRLINVPAAEGEHWLALRHALGPAFGEFVPLNLVVAEMAYTGVGNPAAGQGSLSEAIARIRLGAARQHLDAVLIYEVALESDVRRTGWSVIDWTIIGAYAAGTSRAHAGAYATALLVDVRNGYPYGTATAAAEDERSASTFGSEDRLARQRRSVTDRAVAELMPEVERVFLQLSRDLPAHAAANSRSGV